jgi:hypothetical protein
MQLLATTIGNQTTGGRFGLTGRQGANADISLLTFSTDLLIGTLTAIEEKATTVIDDSAILFLDLAGGGEASAFIGVAAAAAHGPIRAFTAVNRAPTAIDNGPTIMTGPFTCRGFAYPFHGATIGCAATPTNLSLWTISAINGATTSIVECTAILCFSITGLGRAAFRLIAHVVLPIPAHLAFRTIATILRFTTAGIDGATVETLPFATLGPTGLSIGAPLRFALIGRFATLPISAI